MKDKDSPAVALITCMVIIGVVAIIALGVALDHIILDKSTDPIVQADIFALLDEDNLTLQCAKYSYIETPGYNTTCNTCQIYIPFEGILLEETCKNESHLSVDKANCNTFLSEEVSVELAMVKVQDKCIRYDIVSKVEPPAFNDHTIAFFIK